VILRKTFGDAALELFGAASMLLGWRPREFWDATPAELAAALGGFDCCAGGLDQNEIEALRRRFPDVKA
jgi:uncharacterized phage protein (TIGR02216 family)